MRAPSHSRPQPPPNTPTRSSHSPRAKAVHLATPILPSCNYYGNPTHKANECNIPSKDIFYDYCGKERHHEVGCFLKFPKRKKCDYRGKICQHLSLALNQKPRHLSLPLKFPSPKVILVRMLQRKNIMLTRRRCFKPMPLKFNLYKMNMNHLGLNLLI